MVEQVSEEAARVVIVVGASLGGVEALISLVGGLQADLPAALCVVLHTTPTSGPSLLPRILTRSGPLPAHTAREGEPLLPGHIYVAPPDAHLLVERTWVRVARGAKENGFRPAIDPLFRSAARAYGPRALGVILSGLLDDGTAGLRALTQHGGAALVQDPEEALAAEMPRSALTYVAGALALPVAELGAELGRLAVERMTGGAVMDDEQTPERGDVALMVGGEIAAEGPEVAPGTPTPFSCPDCGGVLSEVYDSALLQFACQVGHRFSPESAAAVQAAALDRTLWGAFTALNERLLLLERLAHDAKERADIVAQGRFQRRLWAAEEQMGLLRRALNKEGSADEPDVGVSGA